MTAGECLFDLRLGGLQPIQGLVQFVGIDFTETEQGAERVRCGGVAELPRGGQLRGWFDDAGNDHGCHEPGQTSGPSGQDLLEADPAQRAERGRDMAIRQRTLDREALGRCRLYRLVGKHSAQGIDLGLRPSG
jgi:hypothetical protein